jgi:hypothetical protein
MREKATISLSINISSIRSFFRIKFLFAYRVIPITYKHRVIKLWTGTDLPLFETFLHRLGRIFPKIIEDSFMWRYNQVRGFAGMLMIGVV